MGHSEGMAHPEAVDNIRCVIELFTLGQGQGRVPPLVRKPAYFPLQTPPSVKAWLLRTQCGKYGLLQMNTNDNVWI